MERPPLGDDDADVDDVYGPARAEGERGQMEEREGGSGIPPSRPVLF